MPYNTAPHNQPQKPVEKNHHEHHHDLPVNTTIRKKKNDYCASIKVKLGDLSKAEESEYGLAIIYEHKKCRFIRTEKNYLMYRNLELSIGVELIRSTDRISDNMVTYVTDNTNLVAALIGLVKSVKDARTKFSDLRKAANDLEGCCNERCNRTQMMLLTGEKYEDCDDKKYPEPGRRPHECEDARKILDILIDKPAYLYKEIDTIVNSAADIVGIQTFTNISSLTQTFLPGIKNGAKSFDDFINDRIKAGATDVTKTQTDLTDSIKALTDAEFALCNARIDVDAINGVKDFLCKPDCDCICEGDTRLEKCKCDICEICHEVTSIYYEESSDKQPA
jgi:hypothetical protein